MTQPSPGTARPAVPTPVVASPCVNLCRMNPATGYCDGCLRSIDEIVAWTRLDDSGKRSVLALLPARRLATKRPA